MSTTNMSIISGNYFTINYIVFLSRVVQKIESDCYIYYEDKSASLKDAMALLNFCDVIPGKKVKISCFNDKHNYALKDLNRVRKLIEHDFERTIE